jgi:hypothetical protein
MSQAGDVSSTSGAVPPYVATQYQTDDGIAVPALNILNVLGGDGTETTGSGNTITIISQTDGFAWEEKNTSFLAEEQTGYYCNAALTVTLPATADIELGSTVIIYVDTASSVVIQTNTGQRVQVGNTISAVDGSTTSDTQGSMLELNYKPSDSTWHTIASMGSWDTV